MKKREKTTYDKDRLTILILRIARKAGAPTVEHYLEHTASDLSESQREKVYEDPRKRAISNSDDSDWQNLVSKKGRNEKLKDKRSKKSWR